MSRPIFLLEQDRLAFGSSTPTLQEQVILAPSATGTEFYIGTSSLITRNPDSTISTIQPQNAAIRFDFLSSTATAKGIFLASSFAGEGSRLRNIPFSNLTGFISPGQYAFNSIPLIALSQFGNIVIQNGSIQVGGSITGTTGTFTSIQTSNLAVSNLSIPGTLSLTDVTANTLQAVGIATGSLQVTDAAIVNATIFNMSNENFNTGQLNANTVSTANLLVNSFTSRQLQLFDPSVQQNIILSANFRRLTVDGNALLDVNDLNLLNQQIGSLSNEFYSFSTVAVSSFVTSSIQSRTGRISTLNYDQLTGADISCRSFVTSSFSISSITGISMSYQTLFVSSAAVSVSLATPFISTSQLITSSIQANVILGASSITTRTLSTGSVNANTITGTLADALVTQTQAVTLNLETILPTTTLIDIRQSTIGIPLPITTDRPGRILVIKDTTGIVSRTRPVTLYTLGIDKIDSYEHSYTLTQPYAFLILQASPNSKWNIVATNQYDSINATSSINLGSVTLQTSSFGSITDPFLIQQSADGNSFYPVAQRTPLRTRQITLSANFVTTADDISTYFFMRNTNPTSTFTVFLPNSNTLPNGWTITVTYDQQSSNYIYIRDINTGQFSFLMYVGQTRQIVYTGGIFYSLGGSPPFGIF